MPFDMDYLQHAVQRGGRKNVKLGSIDRQYSVIHGLII